MYKTLIVMNEWMNAELLLLLPTLPSCWLSVALVAVAVTTAATADDVMLHLYK